MKAICLLLCLALAQGHIFKRNNQRQQQRIDDLNVQPLDYINQEQRERYNVPQASEMDHTRPEQRINIERYNPQFEVNSNEETRRPIRERQQQYENPEIRQETSEQYKGLPRTVMNMGNPADYITVELLSKSWNEQGPVAYQPLTRKSWKYIKGRQQQQNVPVRHDSTSDESSWETQNINEYAMPVYRNYESMSDSGINKYSRWSENQSATKPRISSEAMKEVIENIFGEAKKTMQHLSKERKEYFHQILEQTADKVNEDSQLNATQLLRKYQYPAETHTVKTADGYYLTLFRIPSKTETSTPKPVVFLMHGLLGSADDWLLMGPNKSLAYKLSDEGYEVWLGNARGNKYSRRHVSKHPAQSDFWQFSTDEIALHDLPTMIDYVLKTSGQRQMQYVGFSQGATAFFALTAARPEYNEKITMMHALSPMVYMSETRSPMLRMIAPTSPFYERLHQQLGHGEFKPSKDLVNQVGGSLCENEIGCKHVCSHVNFVMAGVNVENMDVERIPVIMAHLPAGASTRQMKQYAQAVASNEFTRYNYGPKINQEVYGSSQPPKYDMSKVETPVTLYYSEDDWLAHPRDVERLAKELRNVQSVNVGSNFSHLDFQFSRNVPQVVYNRLIDSIKQNSEHIYV